MIYLDNAASSHPKPDTVHRAVEETLRLGANPGRSGHRAALDVTRRIFEARGAVAELLGVADSSRVVFTLNATHALNLALKGYLKAGDHVVTTTMEHNSVVRPLHSLEGAGVEVTYVPGRPDGFVPPKAIGEALRRNTRLVVLAHAS